MFVNRSVNAESRSNNNGALFNNSPKAPGFVGMTGTPVGHADFGLASGQTKAGAQEYVIFFLVAFGSA